MRQGIVIQWDGDQLALRHPGTFTDEGDYRFAVVRREYKGALLIAVWDEFHGDPRVTVAVTNGFTNTGNILWTCLRIEAHRGREVSVLHDGGPGGAQVSGTFVRRKTWGSAWYQPTHEPAADWHHELAQKGADGYADTDAFNTIAIAGDYTVGTPKVKGVTSFNGSHGGYRVGPYHFGPEGWQRAHAQGWVWAEREFLAELARTPLAFYDRETLAPYNPHSEYWCGRTNVFLPGHAPVPSERLAELQKYRPHNADHMHRATAAPAMLAPRDVFARIVLVEHYWNDFCCWLDGARSKNPLFQPYWQVMEGPARRGWSRGGRGFAHAVGAFTMAKPYLHPTSRGSSGHGEQVEHNSWGDHWEYSLRGLIRHVAGPAGLVHRMDVDPSHGLPDATRSREADLLFTPMIRLGGLDDICAKAAATMARNRTSSVPESIHFYSREWDAFDFSPYLTLADDLPPYRDGYYPLYDLIRGDDSLKDQALEWQGKVGDPFDHPIALLPPE